MTVRCGDSIAARAMASYICSAAIAVIEQTPRNWRYRELRPFVVGAESSGKPPLPQRMQGPSGGIWIGRAGKHDMLYRGRVRACYPEGMVLLLHWGLDKS